jgi:hypothetical protein
MIREPAAIGFYPGNKERLVKMIENCFLNKEIGPNELPDKDKKPSRKKTIYGLICPHAGYIYSGPVAAHAYLEQYKDGKPEFFVILGPNHTGIGQLISVYPGGKWKTPLGEAPVPKEIVDQITEEAYFTPDERGHMREHSIEVHVPFLQYLYGPEIPIIPICIKRQTKDMSVRIGNVLSDVLADYDYCLIASTDLTHQESKSSAYDKDQKVIDHIKNLNPSALFDTVMQEHITMCGPGPVSAVLTAGLHNGVTSATILKYATSAAVTGDESAVVGYVSAILKK